ncbi:hypothetical protein B0T11DRAFT_288077 [Plectosphaerella cucumerina]|uniref:Uncharacterized protein n=1 Tax=Plectosphaerella cucumerina TaxID=40658 RepID=A0A8K0TF03_9PEZI|nr:hypothetical protein B0T11DRAFT_288077 [Plectosphaerella cucumerina]
MMMSSPLSDAPRDLSTPSSYATAVQTPGTMPKDVSKTPPHAFSKIRRLPNELERQCQIFLEEQLYINALQMYNQMLVSGQTRQEGPKKSTIVAPPNQLALIMTLTVHPHRTTRLKDKEDIDIVSFAWTYLRNLLAIAGPINADFENAFRHVDRGARRRAASDEMADGPDDRIHNKYALSGSLFHCAQDFWSVVGWAFNCSVIFTERWRFWRPWLEFMVECLEIEWFQRQQLDEGAAEEGGVMNVSHRRGSMLMSYVRSAGSGRSRASHIVKALFANGGQTSRRLFREVFRNETKELTETDQANQVGSVNLDNDEYGGYMNFTDSEGEQDTTRATPKTPKTPHSPQTLLTTEIPDGVAESVNLRLRLWDLLAIAAAVLPDEMVGLNQLALELSRQLREEPINVFQLYLNELRKLADYDPHHSEMVFVVLSDLYNDLLPRHDDPAKYRDPEDEVFALTPIMLVRCFLPWPADKDDLEDNARVALLDEAALLIVDADKLIAIDGVRQVAEKGIQARKAKAEGPKRRGRRAANAQPNRRELYLKETIELSGERMLAYIDCLQDLQAAKSG